MDAISKRYSERFSERCSKRLSQTPIPLAALALLSLSGCTVGPKYERPSVATPPAYKELTPETSQALGWKTAQPADAALHGKWWEIFNDPELNSLEEQVNISNQNVAASTAAFMSARALIREARAQYYPTVTANPSIVQSRQSANAFGEALGTTSAAGRSFTEYDLPFDLTWQADLWGRVRNTVRANINAAQASAADLENVRLTEQAQVAINYYELRNEDSLKQLLDSTVAAYQQSLDLTKVLYDTGIDSRRVRRTRQPRNSTPPRRKQPPSAFCAPNTNTPSLFWSASRPPPFPYPWDSFGPSRRRFLMACPRSFSNAAPILPPPNAAWPKPTPKSVLPPRLSIPPFPSAPRQASKVRRSPIGSLGPAASGPSVPLWRKRSSMPGCAGPPSSNSVPLTISRWPTIAKPCSPPFSRWKTIWPLCASSPSKSSSKTQP